MQTVKRKLAELIKNPNNTRIHPEKQIDEYIRSIKMFGQVRPLVVDEKGFIMAGNGLYDALVKMGETEADCYVISGLTNAQKTKLMLADNKIYELGHTSFMGFDNIIREIGDFDIPGFDADLLKMISNSAQEADNALGNYGVQSAVLDAPAPRVDPNTIIGSTGAQTGTASPYAPVELRKDSGEVQMNAGEQRPYVICPKCGEKIWL